MGGDGGKAVWWGVVRVADAGTKNQAGGHTTRSPEYMNARNIIPPKLNDIGWSLTEIQTPAGMNIRSGPNSELVKYHNHGDREHPSITP